MFKRILSIIMSIWPQSTDVDNKSPQLPQPDDIPEQQRETNGVVPMTNTQTGAPQPFISTLNGKLVLSDGTNYVAFIGLKNVSGVMKPVVRIAETGFDAETTADNNLIFNSDQNVLKIAKTDTAQITISGSFPSFSPQTVTIPHNLSITPAAICYVTSPNYNTASFVSSSTSQGLTGMPVTVHFKDTSSNIAALVTISYRVDATNLYLDVTNVTAFTTGFPTWTWNFKYYLLQESAT